MHRAFVFALVVCKELKPLFILLIFWHYVCYETISLINNVECCLKFNILAAFDVDISTYGLLFIQFHRKQLFIF